MRAFRRLSRTTRTFLLLGTAATGAISLATPTPALAGTSAPPCVSVVTPTLGAFQAGNTLFFGEVEAAPGLVSGAVLGPLSQVPGVAQAEAVVNSGFPKVENGAGQISTLFSSGLTTFSRSVGPLEAANPALDALVALGSNGLAATSDNAGTSIAPFNGTLSQLAQTIAWFSSSSCEGS